MGIYQNTHLSFVALNNEKIIGAVLVGTDGRRGYLQHLTVNNAYRGKGIGKDLVQHSIQALSKLGIDKSHLFVHDNNIIAQGFYEKLGWSLRDELMMYSFNNSNNSHV